MAKLIYSAIMSLDGYTADQDGKFDWSAPDEEVHAFVNDLMRPVGTLLLGRKMYEVMVAWETWQVAGESVAIQDFAALWHGTDKVVYSKTLNTVSSARTTIERDFDTAAVRELKATAERDLSIAGPELAAKAIKAGLIDQWELFVNPVIVGGGRDFLPDGIRIGLELVDERRFANGVVHLRYQTRSA